MTHPKKETVLSLLASVIIVISLSAPAVAVETDATAEPERKVPHYTHPSEDEIPVPRGPVPGCALEFDAGALVDNTPGAASTFADIAIRELFSPDSAESPLGSDSVKYNDWYYGRRISNSYENGEYRSRYDWNAAFVSWCADELGYIEMGRFPRTADGGDMLCQLLENDYEYIQSSSIIRAESFDPVRTSDIIFIPKDDCGYAVGIVTECGSGHIRFIMGDEDSRVMELTMVYGDFPADVSFVRVKPVQDYGLYMLCEFLRDELNLNTAAASGIVANLWYESSFDPNRLGDGGTSFGICQWHNERREYLTDFCNDRGYDVRSAEAQLQFMKYELETEYDELLSRLHSCEDTREAAYYNAFYFCVDFENPADMEKKANDRGDFACNSVFDRIIDNS